MSMRVFLDNFSGEASDLKPGQRHEMNVLAVLSCSARVSCFDMAEHSWLRSSIADLKKRGLLVEDPKEPYPWHRYMLTLAGHKALETWK